MGIVTLTTDFGTADGYAGELKGVLCGLSPAVTFVDVTHEIPPGDIEAAAWVLGRIWTRYPAGTVHLAVVDPGVGSVRRPLLLKAGERWYVGPDNGTATRVLASQLPEAAWVLEAERYAPDAVSSTFHGRDLFAPAAALVSSGTPADRLGCPLATGELARLELPAPTRSRDLARGRVVHVDRFGNLVTDIPAAWVSPSALTEIRGTGISGVRATYTSVQPGALVAVIGSAGTLEISVRDGSAAARLAAGRGEPVSVRPERD